MRLTTKEQIEEYTNFAVAHERSHTLQSYEWGLVKSNWINEYVLVRDSEGSIKASLSILLRKTPLLNLYYMYAPRGPICDLHDKEALKSIADGAREIAKKYNGIALKIDTDAPASDLEYVENMKALGFKLRNDYTNLEGVQARFDMRIDIKDKTPEQIMAAFHSKTRYNVRLAQKRGVEIKVGSREDIPVFYELMVETGKRDGFVVRDINYFYKLYDCLGPKYHRLFLAYYNGVPVAGSVCTVYGSKCLYLYGASSNQYRNTMAAYLIQWSMILWAVENKEGSEASEVFTHIGDVMTSVSKNMTYDFASGIQELSSAISTSGSVAEMSGDSMERYTATIGSLIEQTGRSGSELANAYKMIAARVK